MDRGLGECPGLDPYRRHRPGLVPDLLVDVDDDGHVVGCALSLALVAVDLRAAHVSRECGRAVGEVDAHALVLGKRSFW